MSKKLVSRTAKVLSETKKSRDKEAIAIAYEHIPRSPEEQSHGSIYAVIELEDSSGHAEQIAESIIDTLHNEYYLDTERDSLASFESALAKVNEELAERSGEGQINWLGKLNAVLGVLSGTTLHLSQAGKAEAYLYRGEHTIHITEDLAGDSINPLRTFINVASGDLSENDRMALVTPGVFLKISKTELKKYATAASPRSAVEAISALLSGENGNTLPNAALILEMISPEAFAVEPEPEAVTEAWVKEEKKPLEEVSETTLKGTAKVFDLIGKAASGASAFISGTAIPQTKVAFGKVSATVKGFQKDKGADRVIIESEERLHHLENPMDHHDIDEADGILETPAKTDTMREIRITEEKKPKFLSLERFDFSFAKNAKSVFLRGTKRLRVPKTKNSLLYLVGAAVLLVIVIALSVQSSNAAKVKKDADNKFSQARSKYSQAVSEISSGARPMAIQDLTAAETLAKDANVTKYHKADATKLIADINSAKDQARGIIKNTAKVFADFGKGELGGLYSDGTLYYGVSFNDGSVYSLEPKTKVTGTVVSAPSLDGKIKMATLVVKRKTLVVCTTANSLYEIDLVSKKTTKQSVSGGLENGVALASYNTNIYVLSAADNQIYKHIKTSGGYGQKAAYLAKTETVDFSRAVDLAIDSDVYVLSNDGSVQKFTSGAKEDYALKGTPGEIARLTKVFADNGVKGQYLAGSNKVVKIDENQNFVAQYISDSVKNVKGILVDDSKNTIYALSDGKVFSIEI